MYTQPTALLGQIKRLVTNYDTVNNSSQTYFVGMRNLASAMPSDVCRMEPVCNGIMSNLAALSPGPQVVWTHGGNGRGFAASSSLTILYSQMPPYTPSLVYTASRLDINATAINTKSTLTIHNIQSIPRQVAEGFQHYSSDQTNAITSSTLPVHISLKQLPSITEHSKKTQY